MTLSDFVRIVTKRRNCELDERGAFRIIWLREKGKKVSNVHIPCDMKASDTLSTETIKTWCFQLDMSEEELAKGAYELEQKKDAEMVNFAKNKDND